MLMINKNNKLLPHNKKHIKKYVMSLGNDKCNIIISYFFYFLVNITKHKHTNVQSRKVAVNKHSHSHCVFVFVCCCCQRKTHHKSQVISFVFFFSCTKPTPITIFFYFSLIYCCCSWQNKHFGVGNVLLVIRSNIFLLFLCLTKPKLMGKVFVNNKQIA